MNHVLSLESPPATVRRERKSGIGSHESTRMGKDEWLTPPELINALGRFDLDPCSPINRPWPTAAKHFTVEDDGLSQPWTGRVWLNPPYGNFTASWLQRLVEHGTGTALIFARTETECWFNWVWPKASAILFVRGRISFYHVTGAKGDNSGAPSAIIAYGNDDALKLKTSGIAGALWTP